MMQWLSPLHRLFGCEGNAIETSAKGMNYSAAGSCDRHNIESGPVEQWCENRTTHSVHTHRTLYGHVAIA